MLRYVHLYALKRVYRSATPLKSKFRKTPISLVPQKEKEVVKAIRRQSKTRIEKKVLINNHRRSEGGVRKENAIANALQKRGSS